MDWLIDRMTTASSVGGSDLTPVMEHWYEDPEEINGEFPGTHEFLDGPNGKGPDDNPQQDVCDNMAAYCAKEGVDIRYQTEAKQLVTRSWASWRKPATATPASMPRKA